MPSPSRLALIPCLRYDDAPAAILFLCDAFGFLPHAIYADEEDQELIHHAQLLLDGNMVMLGSLREDDAPEGAQWLTPREAGGVTQSIHVVIADPDSHHAGAVAAGAEIVAAPHDNVGYPGRGYTALDPEGHVWSFSDYDPWAAPHDA